MLYLLLGVSMLLINACTESKHAEIVYSDYLKYYTPKNLNNKGRIDSVISENKNFVTFFDYTINNKLVRIKGKLDNIAYGHLFTFDSIGHLTKYSYLVGDGAHNSYEIEKSFLEDNYTELGSPFVDYMLNKGISYNSKKKYSFLFSSFPRKILKISFSTNGRNYDTSNLYQSKIMPLLMEMDLYCNPGDTKVFFKIETEKPTLMLNTTKVFYDTINLK